MNINTIQAEMRARGSHWWSPDTMRFFGTAVASPVYEGPGGVFFVTRDDRHDRTKGYTVRRYDRDEAQVETVGDLAGYESNNEARNAARDAAAQNTYQGEASTVVDAGEHRPITDAEQLAADLHEHTGRAPSTEDVAELVAAARIMHRLREHQCNGDHPCCDIRHEREPEDCPACDGTGVAGMAAAKLRCERAAKRVGAKGCVLQGDPRGCTFKLVFADGATNDWGREGWCVPTLVGAP